MIPEIPGPLLSVLVTARALVPRGTGRPSSTPRAPERNGQTTCSGTGLLPHLGWRLATSFSGPVRILLSSGTKSIALDTPMRQPEPYRIEVRRESRADARHCRSPANCFENRSDWREDSADGAAPERVGSAVTVTARLAQGADRGNASKPCSHRFPAKAEARRQIAKMSSATPATVRPWPLTTIRSPSPKSITTPFAVLRMWSRMKAAGLASSRPFPISSLSRPC